MPECIQKQLLFDFGITSLFAEFLASLFNYKPQNTSSGEIKTNENC
jgi:hypothetical protein